VRPHLKKGFISEKVSYQSLKEIAYVQITYSQKNLADYLFSELVPLAVNINKLKPVFST
jgi:hypothetical protein